MATGPDPRRAPSSAPRHVARPPAADATREQLGFRLPPALPHQQLLNFAGLALGGWCSFWQRKRWGIWERSPTLPGTYMRWGGGGADVADADMGVADNVRAGSRGLDRARASQRGCRRCHWAKGTGGSGDSHARRLGRFRPEGWREAGAGWQCSQLLAIHDVHRGAPLTACCHRCDSGCLTVCHRRAEPVTQVHSAAACGGNGHLLRPRSSVFCQK